MDASHILASIPLSGTDGQLRDRGYDLLEEYLRIIEAAGFDPMVPVLELASGPGRAAAVLSRLGFRIITGDITLVKAADMQNRMTPKYRKMLSVCQLDMEHLPFPDDAVHSILCLNTIHELDNPVRCVDELIRVHQPGGTLVLSDFNEEGFDLMQEIHMLVHGKDHFRAPTDVSVLLPQLRNRYEDMTQLETALNTSYIFRKKRG